MCGCCKAKNTRAISSFRHPPIIALYYFILLELKFNKTVPKKKLLSISLKRNLYFTYVLSMSAVSYHHSLEIKKEECPRDRGRLFRWAPR